eukprot:2117559-Alexandrium_andersonii.AAC.1
MKQQKAQARKGKSTYLLRLAERSPLCSILRTFAKSGGMGSTLARTLLSTRSKKTALSMRCSGG